MTFDEIRDVLAGAETPSDEVLRAALEHADRLAPLIADRVGEMARGICLLPPDDRLVFHGLHVLAAARWDGVWPLLVSVARLPGDVLTGMFAYHADISLARMMLTVWDGDVDGLLRLIEHADMPDVSKWALFDMASRATFDGRIARDTFAAFLERFEQDGLAEDDSSLWWSWQLAVARLGLTALEPALRRVWAKPAFETFTPDEFTETIATLQRAEADPKDGSAFDEASIRPITDVVDALAWVGERMAAMADSVGAELDVPGGASADGDDGDDPAADLLPAWDHLDWMERFLVSRQVPVETMPLEMVDGFLTAQIVGPQRGMVPERLALIWGEEPGQAPEWADDRQRAYFDDGLQRLVAAITLRRDRDAPHVPLMSETSADPGADWAEGFLIGIGATAPKWEAMLEDRRALDDTEGLYALAGEETESFAQPLVESDIVRIVERLPVVLQRIARYWSQPSAGYPRTQPVRVAHVGRNDPCPCGSGKKYKKCCALKPPPVMH